MGSARALVLRASAGARCCEVRCASLVSKAILKAKQRRVLLKGGQVARPDITRLGVRRGCLLLEMDRWLFDSILGLVCQPA
jgi:hypothetical protein